MSDTYDWGDDGADTAGVEASLGAAWNLNPDDEARVKALAKTMDVTPEVARGERATLDSMVKTRAATAQLAATPRTKAYLADPEKAAVAHDQIGPLTAIERAMRAVFGFAGDLGGDVASAAYGLSAQAVGGVQAVSELGAALNPLPETATSRLYRATQTRQMNNFRRSIEATAESLRPQVEGNLAKGFHSGIQSLAQNVPLLAAGFMTGQPGMALAGMGGLVGGGEYAQARDAGKGVAQSAAYGASQGAIEIATEKLPVSKLIGDLGKGTPLWKTIMHQLATELPGEQIATVWQDLNEWATLHPERPFSEYLKERPNAALQTAVATVVSTGGNIALVKGAEAGAKALDARAGRAVAARASLAQADTITEAVRASPMAERDPEGFEELMANMAEGEEVFIPAGAVQTYLQSLPPEQQAIATEAWGVADQLAAAVAAGADVVIPAGTYFAKIAPTEAHEALKDVARFGMSSDSVAEADAFDENKGETLAAEVDRVQAMAQAQDATAEQEAPGRAVYAQVLAQATAAGYSETEAKRYAALWRARYETRGARTGTDAATAFERSGVTIQAGQGTGEAGVRSLPTRLPYKFTPPVAPAAAAAPPMAAEAATTPVQALPDDLLGEITSTLMNVQTADDGSAQIPMKAAEVEALRGAGLNVSDAGALDGRAVLSLMDERAARNKRADDALRALSEVETANAPPAPPPEPVAPQVDPLLLSDLEELSGRAPTQAAIYGPSLLEFVSRAGGIVDRGGELSAMDAQVWHRAKPFRRKLIAAESADTEANLLRSAERVAEKAADAGYLPKGAGEAELLVAIRRELAGDPVYSETRPTDLELEQKAMRLDALEQTIGQLGLSVNDDPALLAEALSGLTNEDPTGQPYEGEDIPFFQAEPLDAFTARVKEQQGLAKFDVSDLGDTLRLDLIALEPTEQLDGKGTAAMEELTAYADRVGKRITLTPIIKNARWNTTSPGRLTQFYKRFGFVENKGRKRDFSTKDSMIREPQKRSMDQSPIDPASVAFKAWFGDSKVVDESGKPLVVYHGTNQPISAFNIDHGGKSTGAHGGAELGLFFTSNPDNAGDYAEHAGKRLVADMEEHEREVERLRVATEKAELQAQKTGNWDAYEAAMAAWEDAEIGAINADDITGQNILPVYLSLQNPKVIERAGAGIPTDLTEQIAAAKAEGHDGFIMREVNDPPPHTADHYVVFEPTQAKSVFNRGTFDPRDPRILNQPAFHGSPHIFDRFTTAAIGTGEGAQAFGWGLYFAGRKEIATWYRDILAGEWFMDGDGNAWDANRLEHLNVMVEARKGNLDAALARAKDLLTTAPDATRDMLVRDIAELERVIATGGVKPHPGRLYEVDIPEDDEYLLHDEPLSAQPPKVREALAGLGYEAATEADAQRLADILAEEEKIAADRDPRTNRMVREQEWFSLTKERDAIIARQQQTGAGVYKALSRKLAVKASDEFKAANPGAVPSPRMFPNGDELASKVLHDAGVGGIKYRDAGSRGADGGDSYNYVVFSEDRVAIRSYEQEARGNISLSDTGAIIRLFTGKDRSTLLHEGGHLWLEELAADAALPDATDQIKADFELVREWLGLGQGEPIGVPQHEQWARGVEAYLMEGRAPSRALRSVFRTFKEWLTRLYRTVRALDVELSPQVRDVMDRLLAVDEEIADAKRTQVLNPVFDSAADAGMTEAEFAAYTRMAADADQAQHDKLLNKAMAGLRKEHTKAWRERREALRPEVEAMVAAQPDLAAMDYMQTHGTPMSRTAVVEIIGGTDALPRRRPALWSADSELHPDALAEVLGLSSGKELLGHLADYETERANLADKRNVARVLGNPLPPADPRVARIEAELDRRLREQFGDPLEDGTLEQEARDAVNHLKAADMLGAEVRYLGRMAGVGEGRWTKRAMEDYAANAIENTLAAKLRPDVYLRAERTAGIEAQRALLAKDYQAATDAKFRQLLNLHLYRAAKDADVKVERAYRQLGRIAGLKTNPTVDQAYLEQAHGLLERFGLRIPTEDEAERRTSFEAFVLALAADGAEVYAPERLLNDAYRTNHTDLTVEQLLELHEVVAAVVKLGRGLQTVRDGERQRALEEVVDEAWANAEALPTMPPNLRVGKPRGWQKTVSGLRTADATLVKVETLADWLDSGSPTGVFNRILIQPATLAANLDQELHQAVAMPIAAAFNRIPKATSKTWSMQTPEPALTDPETGMMLDIRRGDLLAIALNVGNESNLEKLLEGYSWDEQSVLEVLDRHLTKEEWDFIQATWDGIELLWPYIVRVERELQGVEPEKVRPRLVTTRFGDMRGGYFPAVYDPARDPNADRNAKQEIADMMAGSFITAATPKGHTKGRTGYKGPLLLDMNAVVLAHTNKVIKRIAYGEFVRDAGRFIRQKRIRALIQQKLGVEYYDQLMPWLARQVNDNVMPLAGMGWWSTLARKSRTNWQVAVMGFSVTTGAAQIAGLANSSAEIGPEWVAHGLQKTARLVTLGQLDAYVFERSDEMRTRNVELDRDLRDALIDTQGKQDPLSAIRRAAMAHIGFMDRFGVSTPTWIGAFDKALSEDFTEAEAVTIADKAIRRTQGSGRAKDLAAFQGGDEYLKLFSLAYSYFNVLYNRQRDVARWTELGDYGRAFNYSFWLMAVSPIAGAILTGDWPDDDDTWWAWAIRKTFFGLFSGVPIVRDVASVADRKLGGKFASFGSTPITRIGESVFKLSKDMVDASPWGDGEVSDGWVKHALEATGLVLGVPGTQPARTITYLWDVADGDQHPDSVWDVMLGLAKGPQEDQE